MKFREMSRKYMTLIWTKFYFPGKSIKYFIKNHQTLVKFCEKRSELMSRSFANDCEIKFKSLWSMVYSAMMYLTFYLFTCHLFAICLFAAPLELNAPLFIAIFICVYIPCCSVVILIPQCNSRIGHTT